MKLYTKRGDKGETSLASGEAVRKSSKRIEAYGTLDELNALLGLASEALIARHDLLVPEKDLIIQFLINTQTELFSLGSELSFAKALDPKTASWDLIDDENVAKIEAFIDQISATLPPLRNFILPGGSQANAWLHLARTVCRRAERRCWSLDEEGGEVRPVVLIYLNRLSDCFFCLSRKISQIEGSQERLWNARTKV